MDEKKATTTPTPNQHNLMAEVPNRRYGKILGIMALVLVIVVAIGSASWYFIINKSSSQPVAEVKTETQDTEEEESQELVKDAYLIAQLPLDEKTSLAGISLLTINFKERKVSELYTSKVKEQPNLIGVVNDKIFYAERVEGYFRKIVSYDTETKKAETILEVKAPIHYEGINFSPDKDKLVFTEACGLECLDKSEGALLDSMMKIYDLKTKTARELRSFSMPKPFLTVSGPWLSSEYVTVDYVCGCDGTPDLSLYKVVDVENGNVVEVMLADNTNTSQLNQAGTQIAYTTSDISADKDEDSNVIKSTVELKDIASGSSKTLATSTNSQYEIISWLDEQSVLVKITHAEKFEGGLIGMYPIGKIDLGIMSIKEQSDEVQFFVTGADVPVVFGVASPYILFAKESPFVGQNAQATKTLSVYNYLTDETFLLNTPSIFSAELIN